MSNRVMKAIRGNEKPWVVYALWLFAGNMIWFGYYLDSVYIDHFVYFDSIYYNTAIALLVFYFPFSIYLLWKNIKNMSPLRIILTRLTCGILATLYLPLAYLTSSGVIFVRYGTDVGVDLSSVSDRHFIPIKEGNILNIYIDHKIKYQVHYF